MERIDGSRTNSAARVQTRGTSQAFSLLLYLHMTKTDSKDENHSDFDVFFYKICHCFRFFFYIFKASCTKINNTKDIMLIFRENNLF